MSAQSVVNTAALLGASHRACRGAPPPEFASPSPPARARADAVGCFRGTPQHINPSFTNSKQVTLQVQPDSDFETTTEMPETTASSPSTPAPAAAPATSAAAAGAVHAPAMVPLLAAALALLLLAA